MAKKNEPLNARQMAFVEHFLVSLNATDAAIKAGYSEKSARSTASVLLTNPNIQNAIDVRRKAKELEFQIEREKVLSETAALAFTDMMDFCDMENGQAKLKDFDALPRYMRKAVKKIVFRTLKTTVDVEGEKTVHEEVIETKIELHDKIKALDLLGRHFGMWEGDGKESDKRSAKTQSGTILDAVRRAASRGTT